LSSTTTSYGGNQGNNSSNNTPSSNKAHDNHDLLDFGGATSHTNTYKVNQDTSKKPDLMSFDNLF